jgi:hypothetical protein
LATDRKLIDAIEEVATPQTTLAEILAVAEGLQKAGIESKVISALTRAGLTVTLGAEDALPEPRQWYPAIQPWAECRPGCRPVE